MEETISIKELFQTIRKRLNLILIITIAAVLVSGFVSYFVITSTYQASTQILVNQSKNQDTLYTGNEVQTNLQLINTYNTIIKSPAILDKVIKQLNLNTTSTALNGKITISTENNSQVINLSVQDKSPIMATNIANKIANVFQTEIVKIMNVQNVSVLAKADLKDNQSPVKPKPLINIAIALVVGLMAGVGIAYLLEYLDNTIKTEQDIEKALGLPVLGTIATIEDSNFGKKKSTRDARVRGESVGY